LLCQTLAHEGPAGEPATTLLIGVGLNLRPPPGGQPIGAFVLEAMATVPAKAAGLCALPGASEGQGKMGLGLAEGEAAGGATLATAFWVGHLGACLRQDFGLYAKEGWGNFQAEYARHCVTIGQPVRWLNPARETRGEAQGTAAEATVPPTGQTTQRLQELTGLARGLNADGHLELVGTDGTVHVVHSGEIVAQAAA
jgi:hypothetical protein